MVTASYPASESIRMSELYWSSTWILFSTSRPQSGTSSFLINKRLEQQETNLTSAWVKFKISVHRSVLIFTDLMKNWNWHLGSMCVEREKFWTWQEKWKAWRWVGLRHQWQIIQPILSFVTFKDVYRCLSRFFSFLFQAFIHVSTAYANCNRREIEEKFYKPAISGEEATRLAETLDEKTLDTMTPE